MNCQSCNKPHHFYMGCTRCVAKHLLMIFKPIGMHKQKYLDDICKKYKVAKDDVMNEVKLLKGNN